MSIQLVSRKVNTFTSSSLLNIIGEEIYIPELEIPPQIASLIFVDVLAFWYLTSPSYVGAMRRSFVILWDTNNPDNILNWETGAVNDLEIVSVTTGTPNIGFLVDGNRDPAQQKTYYGKIGISDEVDIEAGTRVIDSGDSQTINVCIKPPVANPLFWESITDIYAFERL